MYNTLGTVPTVPYLALGHLSSNTAHQHRIPRPLLANLSFGPVVSSVRNKTGASSELEGCASKTVAQLICKFVNIFFQWCDVQCEDYLLDFALFWFPPDSN